MKNLTFVALGDSLTFGYGIPKTHTLTAKLQADFPALTIHNRGVNGEVAPGANARLETDVLAEHPDLVSIWLGSNDAFLPQHHTLSLSSYETNMVNMIEKIKKDTNAMIVLFTLPTLSDTKGDFLPINFEVVEIFANKTKEIAHTMGCELIDFYTLMQENSEKETFYQHDGLHLNEICYTFLYTHFKKFFEEKFI
ncbi:MAG: SGNH/GDSL hydrolase family protein [Bacillota bacterium]